LEKTLICVVGPTAIGKTSLAIQLAQHFNTEIVSADSRQFFKEMSIGTAKPTKDELAQAKHHFIGHKSIHEAYTAGTFEKEAINLLDELFKSHNVVICVGGSGLYIKALTDGIDDIPSSLSIRNELNQQLEKDGIEKLQNQLKELDPVQYKNMDIHNPQRIVRALEVCIHTGKPYSSFLQNEKAARSFKTLTVGLTADREIIYDRINKRVDIMMQDGLLNEAKSLYPHRHLNALNTVGYKELFSYFDGNTSLEKAIELIKQHTRQFAKRQLTWFKKNQDVKWFNIQHPDTIIGSITSILKN